MDEKVIREFRVIETEDGFRIEIKGDKEQLRDFVMNLDPRGWMHGPFPFGGPHGPGHHGRHGKRRGGPGFGFGPFGAFFGGGWGWEDEEDEPDKPKRESNEDRT